MVNSLLCRSRRRIGGGEGGNASAPVGEEGCGVVMVVDSGSGGVRKLGLDADYGRVGWGDR